MDVDQVPVAAKTVSSLATMPSAMSAELATEVNYLLQATGGRAQPLVSVVPHSTALLQAHPLPDAADFISRWATIPAAELKRGHQSASLVGVCMQLMQVGTQRFLLALPQDSDERIILHSKVAVGALQLHGLPIVPTLSCDSGVTMLYHAAQLFRVWYEHKDAYSATAARRVGAALLWHCMTRAQQGLLAVCGQYEAQDSASAIVLLNAFSAVFGAIMKTALALSELQTGEMASTGDARTAYWKFFSEFKLADFLCGTALRSLKSMGTFTYNEPNTDIRVRQMGLFGKTPAAETLVTEYLTLLNPAKRGAGFTVSDAQARTKDRSPVHAIRQLYLLEGLACGASAEKDNIKIAKLRVFACYVLPLVYGVGWQPFLRIYDSEPFMQELLITGSSGVLPYFAAPLLGSDPSSAGTLPRAFSLLEAVHNLVQLVSAVDTLPPADIGLYLGPEVAQRYVDTLLSMDNIPEPRVAPAKLWEDKFCGCLRPDITVTLLNRQLGCPIDRLFLPLASSVIASAANVNTQQLVRGFACAAAILRALDTEHRFDVSDAQWGPNAAAEFKRIASTNSAAPVLYILLGCDSPLVPLQLAYENPNCCVFCISTTSFARVKGIDTGYQTVVWSTEMRDKMAEYYDATLLKRVEFNGELSFDAVHADPMLVYSRARHLYTCASSSSATPPARVVFISNHWTALLLHNVDVSVHYRWTQLFLAKCAAEIDAKQSADSAERFCFITTQNHIDSPQLERYALKDATTTTFVTARVAPSASVVPAVAEAHSTANVALLYVTVHRSRQLQILESAMVVNRNYARRTVPNALQLEYLQTLDDASRRGESLSDSRNPVVLEAAAFSLVRPLLNETNLLLRNSLFLFSCAQLSDAQRLVEVLSRQIAEQLASLTRAVCAARSAARNERAFTELNLEVLNTLSTLSATAASAGLQQISAQITSVATALNEVSPVSASALNVSTVERVSRSPIASLEAVSSLDCVMSYAAAASTDPAPAAAAPATDNDTAILKKRMRYYGAGLVDLFEIFKNVKFLREQRGGDCVDAFAQLAQTFIAYVTELTADFKENLVIPWNEQDDATQASLGLSEEKRAGFFDDRTRYTDYLVKRFRDPFHQAWQRVMRCLSTLSEQAKRTTEMSELLPSMLYLQMIHNLINAVTYLMSRRLSTKALRSHFAYQEKLVLEQLADAHLFTQAQARKLQTLMFYENNWMAPFTASNYGALGYKFLTAEFDPSMFDLIMTLMHSTNAEARRLMDEAKAVEAKEMFSAPTRALFGQLPGRFDPSSKEKQEIRSAASAAMQHSQIPSDLKPEEQLMSALSELISAALYETTAKRMSVPPFLFMLNADVTSGSEAAENGRRLLNNLQRIGALLHKKSNQDGALLVHTSSHIVSFMIRTYSILGARSTLTLLQQLYDGIEAVDELEEDALQSYFLENVTSAHAEFTSVTSRYIYRVAVDNVQALLEFTDNKSTLTRIKEMPNVIHSLKALCADTYYVPQDRKELVSEDDNNDADDSDEEQVAEPQRPGEKRKKASGSETAESKKAKSDADKQSMEYRSLRDYISTDSISVGTPVNEVVVQSSSESEEIVFAVDKLSDEQVTCTNKIFATRYVYDALKFCQLYYYEAHSVAVAHGAQNPNLAVASLLIRQFIDSKTPLKRFKRSARTKETFLNSLDARWCATQLESLGAVQSALDEFIDSGDDNEESALNAIPFYVVTKVLFDNAEIESIFENLRKLLTIQIEASTGGEPAASLGLMTTYFFRLWMLCAVLNEISPVLRAAVAAAFPTVAAQASMTGLWKAFYVLGFTVSPVMPSFNAAALPMAVPGQQSLADTKYDPKNWYSVTERVPFSDAARFYVVLCAVCLQTPGADNTIIRRANDQQFLDKTLSRSLEEEERRVLAMLEYVDGLNSAPGISDDFFIIPTCTALYDSLKQQAAERAQQVEADTSFKWLTSVIKNPYESVSLPAIYSIVARHFSAELQEQTLRWKDKCETEYMWRLQAWKRAISDATDLLCNVNTLNCLSDYYALRTPGWNARLYHLAGSSSLFSGSAIPLDRLDVAEMFSVQFVNDIKLAREDLSSGMQPAKRSLDINAVIADVQKRVVDSTQTAYRSVVNLLNPKADNKGSSAAAAASGGALSSLLATGLVTKEAARNAIKLFSGLAVADLNELSAFPSRTGELNVRKTELAAYSGIQLEELTKTTHKHLLAIESAQITFTAERLLQDTENVGTINRLFELIYNSNAAVFSVQFSTAINDDESISVSFRTICDFVLALARLYASEEELREVLSIDAPNIRTYNDLFDTLFDFFVFTLQFTYPVKVEKQEALPAAAALAAQAKGRRKQAAAPRKKMTQ
jgi:hypothetical protein